MFCCRSWTRNMVHRTREKEEGTRCLGMGQREWRMGVGTSGWSIRSIWCFVLYDLMVHGTRGKGEGRGDLYWSCYCSCCVVEPGQGTRSIGMGSPSAPPPQARWPPLLLLLPLRLLLLLLLHLQLLCLARPSVSGAGLQSAPQKPFPTKFPIDWIESEQQDMKPGSNSVLSVLG